MRGKRPSKGEADERPGNTLSPVPVRTSKHPLRGFSGLIETEIPALFRISSSLAALVLNAPQLLQASMVTLLHMSPTGKRGARRTYVRQTGPAVGTDRTQNFTAVLVPGRRRRLGRLIFLGRLGSRFLLLLLGDTLSEDDRSQDALWRTLTVLSVTLLHARVAPPMEGSDG